MARALRIEQAGEYYHVLSRGIERRDLFLNDSCREDFLERLSELPARFGVTLHAYVLMNNHYHLLLQPAGLNLSQAVQWLNVGYSVWFNRKRRRVGPLFQGRYKSILIGDEGQLCEITRYIHLNPVRIREFGLDVLSRKAKEKGAGPLPDQQLIRAALQHLNHFPWSSYRAYVRPGSKPSWLDTSLVQSMGRTGYRRYVEQGIRFGLPPSPWEDAVVEGYLGTREKLEELKKRLAGNRQEQKGLRQLEGLLDWGRIEEALEKVENKPWKQVCGEHGNPCRDLGFLLGRRYGGLSLKELGERAGGVNYPAVSDAVRRMGKRLDQDKDIQRKYKMVMQILNL